MKKDKTVWWVGGIFVVIIALFLIPQLTDPHKEIKREWKSAGIDCIQGHDSLAVHIHPRVTIYTDGEEETIPANVGIVSTCMAEIHTHDTAGELHLESTDPTKTFTLSDFFTVWGQSLEKEGYSLTVLVDGEAIENPTELIFEDHQEVEMNYISN
ncbi:MAG: hypothetical protein WD471_00165 [Candidatus Paceibacterota bacterium]